MEFLHAHPLLTALGMILAPVALALLMHRSLRHKRFARVVLRVCAALAVPFALWVTPWVEVLSAYDVLMMAALFGAAALVASLRGALNIPRPVLWGTLALLLLGLAGLELRFRGRPPPPMMVPPPGDQMLTITREFREFGTAAVFPDHYGPPWLPGLQRAAEVAGDGGVLHLGDSMVAAGDVGPGEGFVEVLGHETGARHINMGVSNTSTDLHLVLMRRWLRRAHADAVVLHLFSGNDVDEMDRPYRYCAGGPLLGSRAQGMPLRCPTPRWDLDRRALLSQGPSPYPLRVLAWYSALARQLAWRFEHALANRRMQSRDEGVGSERRAWVRLGEALVTLRDEAARERVPLLVSVLPQHEVIWSRDEARNRERRDQLARVMAVCRGAGVPTVDPLPELEAAVRARPNARWFLPPSPHFDVEGHRWYARWIRRQLARAWPTRR